MPIKPAILGKQAMDCRAYAKALHYIEEEFHDYMKSEREGFRKERDKQGMELMEKLIRYSGRVSGIFSSWLLV